MKELLKQGKIVLPGYEKFEEVIGRNDTKMAEVMFKAMWHNYLKDRGSVSLVYWYDKFSCVAHMNIVLKSLSKAGWIDSHSIPARNWAEASIREEKLLESLTVDELQSVRAYNKFNKYKLTTESVATANDKVKLNGKSARTGLVREGFRQASNVQYRYDTTMIEYYKEEVQLNLTKSMDKIALIWPDMVSDRASYDTISCDILNYHIDMNPLMTNGQCDSDSRGRNIQGNLDKVANYISCKDFRASLEIV